MSIFGSRNLKFYTVVELHELHEFMCLFLYYIYEVNFYLHKTYLYKLGSCEPTCGEGRRLSPIISKYEKYQNIRDLNLH
jgi:hypothetical protein